MNNVSQPQSNPVAESIGAAPFLTYPRYAPGEAATAPRLALSPTPPPDDVNPTANLSEHARKNTERGPPSISLKEFLSRPPTLAPLIGGIANQRDFILFYSGPGKGKTTLVADLLARLACGEAFAGHAASPCRVGFMSLDMRLELLRDQLAALKVPEEAQDHIRLFDAPTATIEDVRRFIMSNRLKALFIDTLFNLFPGVDENSYSQTHEALKKVQTLTTELDCTIFGLHHSTKSGTDDERLDSALGSTALIGVPDNLWKLTGSGDKRALHILKPRGLKGTAAERRIDLQFDALTGRFSRIEPQAAASPGLKPDHVSAAVAVVRADPGISLKDLRAELKCAKDKVSELRKQARAVITAEQQG